MTDVHPARLAANEVHVWAIPLSSSEAFVAKLGQVLGRDEQERASRFHFRRLRDSYVVTHGVLRHLLARYLDLHPARISFMYGAQGKPAVSHGGNLQFNLSHSEGMAAIAVATGCALGIDLEHLRPVNDMENIGGSYFCAEEAAEILALSGRERERAFFACWTRKEAYIKAVGSGLSCPLDSFRVSTKLDGHPRLIHIAGDTPAATEWTMHDLSISPHYFATLAYHDRPRTVSVSFIRDLSEFCILQPEED